MTNSKFIIESVFARAILEGNSQSNLAIKQIFVACIDSATYKRALINADEYMKWVETHRRNIITYN